jgi:hypothetical protein
MLAGLPPAPADVTVTVPVYFPALRLESPALLIETLMDDGTVPLAVAESHADAAPVEVVNASPDVPVILTD